jgi:uncharacterized protein YjbI with pentapeptide repeats
MPYTPPSDVLRRNAKVSPQCPAPDSEPSDRAVEAERRQELEVRLTAQRLLGAHLSLGLAEAGMSTYWLTSQGNRLTVDLVGAALVDFNLDMCAVGRANFSEAQFHGNTTAREAQFYGATDSGRARFHGNANMRGAQFHEYASLDGVRFYGTAYVGGAQFHDHATLRMAQFHDNAYLSSAQFHGDIADLNGAQFHGNAALNRVQFHGDADLSRVQFHSSADLRRAQFHGSADLDAAQFTGLLDMTDALATSAVALPAGWSLLAATTENDELRGVVRADDVPSVGSTAPR